MNNKGNAHRFIFNLLLYRFKKTYTYNRRMVLEIASASNNIYDFVKIKRNDSKLFNN